MVCALSSTFFVSITSATEKRYATSSATMYGSAATIHHVLTLGTQPPVRDLIPSVECPVLYGRCLCFLTSDEDYTLEGLA